MAETEAADVLAEEIEIIDDDEEEGADSAASQVQPAGLYAAGILTVWPKLRVPLRRDCMGREMRLVQARNMGCSVIPLNP